MCSPRARGGGAARLYLELLDEQPAQPLRLPNESQQANTLVNHLESICEVCGGSRASARSESLIDEWATEAALACVDLTSCVTVLNVQLTRLRVAGLVPTLLLKFTCLAARSRSGRRWPRTAALADTRQARGKVAAA